MTPDTCDHCGKWITSGPRVEMVGDSRKWHTTCPNPISEASGPPKC